MKLYNNKGKQQDPRFVKWVGEGTLAVQIQKPYQVPVNNYFETDNTLLQFHSNPNKKPSEGERKKGIQYGLAKVRVSSTEKKKPIFATFPIKFHQPLPEDCIITNVYICN